MTSLAPCRGRRRARALLLAVTVAARVLDTQRAVSLPVDSERQRVVTVDASPLAEPGVAAALFALAPLGCGAVQLLIVATAALTGGVLASTPSDR